MHDRRMLEELPRQEALRLLASVPMGRVVFTQRALPAIRPVNHILDGGEVVIRTNLSSSVATTVGHQPEAVVAYEADDIDTDSRTGWSVVITGVARLVRDPLDRARYESLLRPWVENRGDCVLRIRPDIATGFRVTPYQGN
ncbi:pyridoxamine 5'-phosphate oxidase family protein [Micromonospora sonneratiae]|uniref:Pyridoxamine 5'-phosphate oxidase family protein n=1 Tax=Micromonospora sonneratiae TaxID=1184706 RepID=A0ABW3YJC2_9ACTN